MPRTSKSSTQSMNMTLIAVVLALILFGLGYIVGKAKTKVMMYGEFTTWKTQMMTDRTYMQTIIDKMMQSDETRQMLMKKVDEYRSTMKK